MPYCSVHGSHFDDGDGCHRCQEAEERAEVAASEIAERLSELSHGPDYGDYVCPHCRYKTLRRNAARCPLCHENPGAEYWARVDAEIAERHRQRLAAEAAAQAQAEAAAIERERLQREMADARRRRRGVLVFLVFAVVVAAVLVQRRARSPIEVQAGVAVQSQTTRPIPGVTRLEPPTYGAWARSGRSQDLFFLPRSCGATAVSTRHEVLCEGLPLTPPLKYAGREPPHKVVLSDMSPSGRYLFAAVCDLDWCDDIRLFDLHRGKMLDVPLGKYHRVDWVSWSPKENLAILPQTHVGWTELSAVELSSGAAKHLDDLLGGGEMHDADLASLEWAASEMNIRVRVARVENGRAVSARTRDVAIR